MARDFAGGAATDLIQVTTYAAIDNLDTITWAWWAYQRSDGGGGNGRIVEKAGNYVLQTDGNGIHLFGQRWTTDGEWGFAPTLNAWTHYVLTYDHGSVSNDPICYKNGATITVNRLVAPVAPTIGAANNFLLGNNGGQTRSFDGRFAEIAQWNRVLNSTEAASVYNSGANSVPSGLVLYLPTCGVDSPEPNPASPANTGAVQGTTFVSHPPIVGSGCIGAAITGTATASMNEADVVAGGRTIIVTLSGTTFIP